MRITLVLEGTYPYVRGGVSSWVAQLVRGFPEIAFQVVFLGSRREDYRERAYPLYENIASYREVWLFETGSRTSPPPPPLAPEALRELKALHDRFRHLREDRAETHPPSLPPFLFEQAASVERTQLCHPESWRWICAAYEESCNDPSFGDYFWTVRNLHLPLWPLLQVVREIPPADLVFSPSTGYAGFLGAVLSGYQRVPFLLMEHGIYVVERMIDLYSARWIGDHRDRWLRSELELGSLREVWMNFFQTLGRFAYLRADTILSLFPGAREVQIALGAPPERCAILPNGVDIERYRQALSNRPFPPPKRVALIGRVTRIKDILTFIRAMKLVTGRDPEVEGWVVGPLDEEPDYVAECRRAIQALGLSDRLKLLGFRKLDEILPEVGLLVLTSISEGMPLVILEGFAAGLPAVATDVGSCRLLIEGGLDGEDRKLGLAGRVVPVMSPKAVAQAILSLLKDPNLWRTMQQSAIRRVKKYYDQQQMFNRLGKIFQTLTMDRAESSTASPG